LIARTQRRGVMWKTKLEPLSTRVILPRSKGPRIRSRVGTRVVRAGRASRRASGTTMGCATSAIANPPRIRWGRRYKVRGGGEGWAKVLGDASPRSYFYPDRGPCRPEDRAPTNVCDGAWGGHRRGRRFDVPGGMVPPAGLGDSVRSPRRRRGPPRGPVPAEIPARAESV